MKMRLETRGFYTLLRAIATQGQRGPNEYTQELLHGLTGINSGSIRGYFDELEDSGYLSVSRGHIATKKARTVLYRIEFLKGCERPIMPAIYSIVYNRLLSLQTIGFLDYLTLTGTPSGNSFTITNTVRKMFSDLNVASATLQKEIKKLIEIGMLEKFSTAGRKKVLYRLRFNLKMTSTRVLALAPLARDLYIKYEAGITQGITVNNLNGDFYDTDLPNYYGASIAQNIPFDERLHEKVIQEGERFKIILDDFIIYGNPEELNVLLELEHRNRIKRDIGIVSVYLRIFEQIKKLNRENGGYIKIYLVPEISEGGELEATLENIQHEISILAKKSNWLLNLRTP